MSRKLVLVVTSAVLFLFGGETANSAPLAGLFGGKSAREQEQLLEQKEQECRVLIEEKDQQYQKLLDEKKDEAESVQSLRDKNGTLMEAYEKLKTDQEAVVDQLNRLRRENQRCDAVKEDYDKMNLENEAFLDANKSLEVEKGELKVTLENMKLHIQDLNKENERLNSILAESQVDEDEKVRMIRGKVQKELEDLISRTKSLKEENLKLEKQFKDSRMNATVLQATNQELQVEADSYRSNLKEMENEYLEIKQENRMLAEQASEFPKKFTDLARHNHKLLKDTSDMHYNLGVSFIKSQEYERAIKEFNQVLELKPDDALANYNLGYIYAEHLVDRPLAIKYFKNYLAYAKDAKDRDWVKQYIFTWQTWYGKEKVK